MSSKIVIVLRKKPNKEGLFPLAIRITTNRVPKYKQIGEYIKLEDWNDRDKVVKSSHPEADHLNEIIAENILKARKGLILNNVKSKRRKDKKRLKITFFDIAQQFMDELEEEEKYSRISTETAHVNYIRNFHKSNKLSFEEMDERFLRKLKANLKTKHGLKEVSAMNVLVMVRTLFNRAIRQKIVKRKYYPFGKDKIQIKFPETQKIGLDKDEIKSLENLTELSPEEQHALNVWLYSFNFAGVRISDVLRTRWSAFKNGRMYYTMGKNAKLVSLKVPEKIEGILKFYKKDKRHIDDYVFPELKVVNENDPKDEHRLIKISGKKINRQLNILAEKAKIEKKLTMHIARHSFGHIAGETIHPKKLQKLYRHSNLQTTIGYQANFIHSDADEALDSVLNF